MVEGPWPTDGTTAKLRLQLLGGFELRCCGALCDVAPAGQRVLSLLALMGDTHRSRLAGTLWPDQSENRALSNLRSALWRLPRVVHEAVARHGAMVHFAGTDPVDIDLERAARAADLVIAGNEADSGTADHRLLLHDLLPTMGDEWLVVPRERHRQRRLHALEALANRYLDAGRPLDAVDIALAAVDAEPLRESAQLLVVRAHLEAGNRGEAKAHYERFCRLLDFELRLAPNQRLTDLVNAACALR